MAGRIEVLLEGQKIAEVSLVASSDVKKASYLDMINTDSPASVSDSGTKALTGPKRGAGRPSKQPKVAKAGALGKGRGRPRGGDGLKEV